MSFLCYLYLWGLVPFLSFFVFVGGSCCFCVICICSGTCRFCVICICRGSCRIFVICIYRGLASLSCHL